MKKVLILLLLSVVLVVGCNTIPAQEITGEVSNYVDFDKVKYDQAVSEGKTILLEFYANWCPICRSESPKIISGLEEVGDEAIGFRIHFNDGDTTEEHKELAKEFGITLQHTKVIVKDGEVKLKSLESWDEQRTIEELKGA